MVSLYWLPGLSLLIVLRLSNWANLLLMNPDLENPSYSRVFYVRYAFRPIRSAPKTLIFGRNLFILGQSS